MNRFLLRSMLAAVVAVALIGVAGTGVIAQDAVDAPHPAHVHRGSCAELDPEPEYPLADVAPVSPDAEPGSVETGVTALDVSLDDLLSEPFAINVHASEDNVETYIACGDIAGEVVDGTLVIGLDEQNGSGYSGIAVLATTSGGGVEVSVYLGYGLSGDRGAATPVAATSAPAEATVSILDYSFDAATVEFPVGTTVTWANDGGVIHTTTSTDGLWDSGILSSGETFSHTFTEAGTFTYICALHPVMIGTIVVTAP